MSFLYLKPGSVENDEIGRTTTAGWSSKKRPYPLPPNAEFQLKLTTRRSLVFRYCQLLRPGSMRPPGPPRVNRSSKLRALTFTPNPVRQKFLNSQCALKLPPSSNRSPSKLNDDH